ncbi:MAG: type IA DNA topoisomerase [Clostridia bacterium]|nr:type IA DNA topoisomerase [Clostridia bacterium]MBP3800497.1 type IA DNA topoisomerase [Clostridia bacterium]
MGKKLLITEKPSVAMEFAKALKLNSTRKNGYLESENWIITWCVGHLVTMSYPDKYDEKLKFWRLDTLPFIPTEWKYEIIPAVANQFNIIQSLMQRDDIEEIYNAGDSGREGEYIQRLVFMMANPNPNAKMKRVWIDSQTEEEILRGIKEAKDLSEYNSLSDSAYLRAKEDYLIGINFSRLLSIIYGRNLASKINEDKASISVGRVMTCVLGMIVSREREIRNFVKTKYYKVVGEFGDESSSFKAEWKVNEKSKVFESPKLYNETGFKKEDDAKEFIASLAGKEAVVTELKKSKQKENAPLLFNLAEIQNECTKRFKIKPDETLEIIQNLYEKKLVTYPRTDARVLSTAVAKEIKKNLNGIATRFQDEEIKGYINKMAEEKYSTDLIKTKYVNDSKITDHYAIIPTGQGFENYDKLNDLQKEVYKLIVRRFLAIFYPPAEYSKVNATITIENETFYANGKVCINKGFLEVLKPEKGNAKSTNSKENVENKDESNQEKENAEENNTNLDILKSLKKDQKILVKNFEIKDAETSPPTRYNSGSIILAMENAGKLIEEEELREQIKGAGIGTSATRAEIIKKLEKIKYIEINSKTQIITPTLKGETIYDIVNRSMPDMLNPKLTASWEKGLDMVAKKEIEPNEFMVKLEKYINSKFDKLVLKM